MKCTKDGGECGVGGYCDDCEASTDAKRPLDRIVKNYFGHEVIAEKREQDGHPYPWYFTVREPNGTLHLYAGIPNKCESARSALRRGWWRAKWLAEGTYRKHYSNASDKPT